eukprot:TRINITY_DN3350_c0_g1_i1.p1 TRINITY_DN3350_c0_g1~~TRINITY_DN3350_c0_g1_i1.p1  ORF type:complete len:392 (+),score=98.51 TRINITY_DN3350_c0_g1_i1:76-1251(+)
MNRTGFVLFILFILVVAELLLIFNLPMTNYTEFISRQTSRYPLVVMYYGKPEGAPYEWNSGVWSGFGDFSGNRQNKMLQEKLKWAGQGVTVHKNCDVPCYVTKDQSEIPNAHGVVMELVNHQKFYSEKYPVPFPKEKPFYSRNNTSHLLQQKWIMFYYEPAALYSNVVKNPEVLSQIDLTAIPEQNADIPVTLVCDWGKRREDYLIPPPEKTALISDWSYGHNNKKFMGELIRHFTDDSETNIDVFRTSLKNVELSHDVRDGEHFNLYSRMNKMGSYKFILFSEVTIENDYISPEWSQIFLSGSIPVYYGADNINDYVPGPNSFINARDFNSPFELFDYIKKVDNDDTLYNSYFNWKSHGLYESFQVHLDNCVHYAECRICKKIIENDLNY